MVELYRFQLSLGIPRSSYIGAPRSSYSTAELLKSFGMSSDAQASRSTDEVFRSAAAMGRPAVATSRFATAGCFTAEQLEKGADLEAIQESQASDGPDFDPDDKRPTRG